MLVGRGGLRRVHVGGRDEVEIGYAVVPERWRRGYATEIAQASLAVAWERGLAEVVAFTLPENCASRRVIKKAGLVYEREIEWAGLPHVLYRARRPSTVSDTLEGRNAAAGAGFGPTLDGVRGP